jgi:DNA-binding response OmpR family regulator
MIDVLAELARILFVDDDASARAGFAQYLTANGFAVTVAATGDQALSAAHTLNINIVVLDLGLPDIDGWEVARQLKASAVTAHIPIIALTGADLPHERVSAMRAGCDRHLAKPCQPTELLATITRLLTSAEAERRVDTKDRRRQTRADRRQR